MRRILIIVTIACLQMIPSGYSNAQGTISFHSIELNLPQNALLTCDPIDEDDPGDLEEAYSKLLTYISGGTDNQNFELNFLARKASYHWTQGFRN